MNVRTTPLVTFQRSQFDLTRTFLRLSNVQAQLSSGKRITNVSDDPAKATRALDTRVSLIRTQRIRENLALAREASDFQSATLEEISNLISAARSKAQEAANGINGDVELDVLATEIDSLLSELVGLANQSVDGRYLFAGSNVDTAPFKTSVTDGSIHSVAYLGDDLVRKIRVGPNELLDMELSGQDIFLKRSRGPTAIASDTGLAAVKGATDTMVGSVKIALSHTSTDFGDGLAPSGGDSVSGLAAGASSADDTILGDHTITIAQDGSGGGVITLDDGTEVAFDGTETDLAVENSSGDVVHVDVTAIAAGFNGSITVTGQGEIQVGDSAAKPLVFGTDVAFTDSEGRVVHLDTTAVKRVGEAAAIFPGTQSVFDVLIELRDDLLGNGGFDSTNLVDRIQTRLAGLDQAHDTILNSLSKLGSKSAAFERMEGSLGLFELSLEQKRSGLEDTDFFEASLELAQAEAAHTAALQVAARLATIPTLNDYLA